MHLIRVFLTVLLLGFWVNGGEANASTKGVCESTELFFRKNGVAVSVMIAHVLFPISVQSQSCPAETRITDKDYRRYVAAMIVGLGCAEKTKAFIGTMVLIDAGIKEEPLENVSIDKIPKRYRSEDSNFCLSKELVQIKKCGAEPTSCEQIFQNLGDENTGGEK